MGAMSSLTFASLRLAPNPGPMTLDGTNTFAALMEAVRHCTLGEITGALFEVGGKYRRNV